MITQLVDDSKLVTLRGNTHPLATSANDRGAVPDATPMNDLWLQLKRSPESQKAFEQFLEDQQNPKSPNYHKWMTTKQMGDQFGPAPEDLQTVKQWLEASGFTVNQIAPHGTLIDFSGTVAKVRQAFHTEIHYFDVNGEHHYANVSDPQIPAALQPVVVGPVSLHNFMPKPLMVRKTPPANPSFDAGGSTYNVVPADLATIYNFNPAFAAGYTGTGVTIVVVEDTDTYTAADYGVFRKEFGLARPYPNGNNVTQIHPALGAGGFCNDPGLIPANGAEAILDTEWSSAAAPNATIILAACQDTANFGGFIAIENMLSNGVGPIPEVVSISYGIGELQETSAINSYINSLYQYCVGNGVSVFVSSGDEGAAGGDALSTLPYAVNGIEVNAFASTAYDVAVGGTDFGDVANSIPYGNYWSSTNGTYFNSALSYIQEIPWNNSCASSLIATQQGYSETYGSAGFCNSALVLGGSKYTNKNAGSGGPSAIYTKPSFQTGFVGNPADGWRDLPDVSLLAASGVFGHTYVICYSDLSDPKFGGALCTGPPNTWSGSGGTSVASPIVAGIMALIDQKAGFVTNGLGNPIYRLYQLAGSTYGGSSLSQCNSSNGASVSSFCIFYDITQGDNDVPCEGSLNCYLPSGTLGVLSTDSKSYQPAYPTGVGWDFATGIGTINAYNLVTFY
ncbi:MAG TPA: S53 family peptidase [Bryobacteraceae bacterium]|jgi:subtilase family serine protease